MTGPRRHLTGGRYTDEDDVRVRPRPGSRPRTRTRPAHERAVEGTVVAVDRGRWTVRTGDAVVTAMRGSELRRSAVVVGDEVSLVGDVSGETDTLARIVRVAARSSLLRRSADDADPLERPVVANADQLVIVTALADPPPRPRMVDRCLVAAYDGGLSPILCLTKRDLVDARAERTLVTAYDGLDLRVLALGPDQPLAPLAELLAGRVSVLFGHSGVGKSTLINRLVPDADRAVGQVNDVTGRGRHTSSSAVLLALPGGGSVIDTPDVRGFGLGAVSPDRVLRAFPDLRAGAEECLPGCDHRAGREGCALPAWVAGGGSTTARLDSLQRLLASRDPD